MATTNQLVDTIKARLSRKNSPTIAADIVAELVAAKEELESFPTLPMFLITKIDFSVVGDEIGLYSQAEILRFLKVYNEDGLRYNNGASEEPWVKLEKFESLDRLIDRHGGTADYPVGYVLVGSSLILRPTPTASIQYRLRFFQAEETVPAAGNTTLWTQREPAMLKALAGVKMAQNLRDKDGLALFSQDMQIARKNFINRMSAAEVADFDSSRGED